MRIEGKGKHVYLHRFLLDFPEGKNIKFINGNTLDCRRENLKATTVAEFHADRGIGLSNRSGFKGVSFNKASGKFKAYISDNGKLLYLGLFETDIEAARAYNEKARELRGESAYLNQIDEETSDV